MLWVMVTCRRCSLPLRRQYRHGYWLRYVLNLVGVYPWHCKDCQTTFYTPARNTAEIDRTRAEQDEDQRLKRIVQRHPALTPRTPRIIDVEQFLKRSE